MTTHAEAAIHPGDRVVVRDALNRELEATATSGEEPGHTFRVVWARLEGAGEHSAVPWPADDVHKL